MHNSNSLLAQTIVCVDVLLHSTIASLFGLHSLNGQFLRVVRLAQIQSPRFIDELSDTYETHSAKITACIEVPHSRNLLYMPTISHT